MSDVDAMVAWLRSVWDADEQAARAATDHCDGVDEWETITREDDNRGRLAGVLRNSEPVPLIDHMARHDPADVLARIEAERRIVEDYRITDAAIRREVDSGIALDDPWLEKMRAVRDALRAALRALAYGYRHRDGWQQGWAP